MSHRATRGEGAQRLLPPEETLARIQPAVKACGITRAPEVTALDDLGIPVFCAIRPLARVQQVSNGKGLTRDHARVSALMEAIEFFHAEQLDGLRVRRASLRALQAENVPFVEPSTLWGFRGNVHLTTDTQVDWIAGRDLVADVETWLPASAVSFAGAPRLHETTTNGLASGNHALEATLHGLYELVEREATAALLGGGTIPIRERCRVVDLKTVDAPLLRAAIDRIAGAGSHLVAIAVPSPADVPTFWAVLMNEQSWISGTTFNTGWGTHLDPTIALARAITEAAQSRATMIHGAREDVLVKPVFRDAVETRGSKAWRFFRELQGDTPLADATPHAPPASDVLEDNLAVLLAALRGLGHRLYACDLTRADIGVPVMKVLSPTLRLRL